MPNKTRHDMPCRALFSMDFPESDRDSESVVSHRWSGFMRFTFREI